MPSQSDCWREIPDLDGLEGMSGCDGTTGCYSPCNKRPSIPGNVRFSAITWSSKAHPVVVDIIPGAGRKDAVSMSSGQIFSGGDRWKVKVRVIMKVGAVYLLPLMLLT